MEEINKDKKTLSLHAIGKKAFGDGYKYWQYHCRNGKLSKSEKEAVLKVHLQEKAKHQRIIETLKRSLKKYD